MIHEDIRELIDKNITRTCKQLANAILTEFLEMFSEERKAEGNIVEILSCIKHGDQDICTVLESKSNEDFVQQLLLLSYAAHTFSRGGMSMVKGLKVIIYIYFIYF